MCMQFCDVLYGDIAGYGCSLSSAIKFIDKQAKIFLIACGRTMKRMGRVLAQAERTSRFSLADVDRADAAAEYFGNISARIDAESDHAGVITFGPYCQAVNDQKLNDDWRAPDNRRV